MRGKFMKKLRRVGGIHKMRSKTLEFALPNNNREPWDDWDKQYLGIILKPRLPAIKAKIRQATAELEQSEKEMDAALDANDHPAFRQLAQRRKILQVRVNRLQKIVELIEVEP